MSDSPYEYKKVLNPLPEYQAANPDDFTDMYDNGLSGYCRNATKHFGFLDNQGLALDDNSEGGHAVHIDKLYVFPSASSERLPPEMLAQQEKDGETEDDTKTLKLANVIAKTPRLTLLGDPGVGKSTLVQWLVCSLCHWNENYGQQQIGNLFPLVLTARRLTPSMTEHQLSNEAFVEVILNSQGEQLANLLLNNERAKAALNTMLAVGQVLVLVDGLDEISPDAAKWLNQQLRQLLTQYPKSRLLLTSRIVGFSAKAFWQIQTPKDLRKQTTNDETDSSLKSHQWSNDEISQAANLPTNYYLAPFSPFQRNKFATQWVENYLPPNADLKQQFIADIDGISQYSVQLNALSRIPVLLNLLCFIQLRRGKLPNGRAELYQRIVETYLVAMDQARAIKNQLGDKYDYNDIKAWLGKLALQMQAGELVLNDGQQELSALDEDEREDLRHQPPTINEQRILQLSESKLTGFLELQLSEVVDVDELSTHSAQLIHYIKTRTGFLIPKGQIKGEEYYGFSHLSFQEYFSAYAIANGLKAADFDDDFIQALKVTTDDAEWGEIWQLVFEEMSLTGSSRRVIEQQLDCFFDDVIGRVKNLITWGEVPISVILYGKIVLNSAVKLASAKRLTRQMSLGIEYLRVDGPSHQLLSTFVEHLFAHHQSEFLPALLQSKTLYLGHKGVTDSSWLGDLSQIVELESYGISISDFAVLSGLKELESLNLGSTGIVDVSPLASLTNLQVLNLINTKVEDIKPLIGLTKLVNLGLHGTKVTDFEPLGRLNNLSSLHLNGLPISDLSPLVELTLLRELDLSNTKVESLELLSRLPNLNSVMLKGLDVDYSPLLACESLQSVYMASKKQSKVLDKLRAKGVQVF